MRKLGLLAAAAGLALGGSIANADFVVSHSRANNAFTIGSTSYDIVSWTLTNDGTHSTGVDVAQIDAAFYAPANGMVIGLNKANHPDVYGIGTETGVANDSWLNGKLTGVSTNSGQSVLLQTGSTFTVDQQNPTGDKFSGTYTNQQSVAGIAGNMFWTTPPDISATDGFGAPITFAQIAVPHGDPVELLGTGAANRGNVPASWESIATGFGEDPNDGISNGVFVQLPATIIDGTVTPEPASLSILGIMAAGLLARRRHA